MLGSCKAVRFPTGGIHAAETLPRQAARSLADMAMETTQTGPVVAAGEGTRSGEPAKPAKPATTIDRRGVGFGLAALLAGGAIAFAGFLLVSSGTQVEAAPWPTALALAVGALTVALIGLAAGMAYGTVNLPTVWAMAPLGPGVATVTVVAIDLIAPSGRGAASLILGLEITAALVVIGAIPLRLLANIRIAQTRSYWELRRRAEQLRERLNVIDVMAAPGRTSKDDAWSTAQQMSRKEAKRQLEEIEKALAKDPDESLTNGLEWVGAMGYVSLWRRVGRAEEALLDLEPRSLLIADALHDHYRLRDSGIKREDLEFSLEAAIKAIDPASFKDYFRGEPRVPNTNQPAPRDETEQADPVDDPRARAVLREVRHAINLYMEDAMEGIVRARNRLWRTILVTAIVTFLLVALAVLGNVSKSELIAASVFFLVAAAVGLFDRLRRQAKAHAAIEDYNLFEARLLETPLLSGLAGVAGVVLTALAPVASGQPVQSLTQVFDLHSNALGLVVAAAFGLTPDRILRPLESQTDKLKDQLSRGKAAVAKPSGDEEHAATT
jgi:hypothetical protein